MNPTASPRSHENREPRQASPLAEQRDGRLEPFGGSYTNRATFKEVQYKRGTEEQAGQQRVGVDHVHFMSLPLDVTTVDLLEYDGDKYNVHSVEIIAAKKASV